MGKASHVEPRRRSVMDRNLNQQTYGRLKRDILTFGLKPGEQISAAKVAERYHVSRTPAREALVKLETEGMLEIYPKSGTVISKIDVHRVEQEWFIRKALELAMADAFIKKVTDRDIDLMRAYNRELVALSNQPVSPELVYDYLCADNDFHAVSYMVAGERLSATIIDNMMAHYNRIRMLVDLEPEFKERTISDHERLIACVEARDVNAYRAFLTEHLGHIVTDIENMREKHPYYFETEKEN